MLQDSSKTGQKDAGGGGDEQGGQLRSALDRIKSQQQERPTPPPTTSRPAASAAAPAGPEPAEVERQQLTQRASSLGSRLNAARSKATLGDLRGSLGRLDSILSAMPAALEKVRRGGYV